MRNPPVRPQTSMQPLLTRPEIPILAVNSLIFLNRCLYIYVLSFTTSVCILRFCVCVWIGGNRGEPRNPNAPRSGAPAKVLPIEIPSVALDELNRMAGNFGNKALIGEGSYGRVFCGKFKGEAVAIKKLDASSSEEPDSDFTSQVHIYVTKTVQFCLFPGSIFNPFSLPLV